MPSKCPREEVQAPDINIANAEIAKIIEMAGEHLNGFRYRRTKGNIINFNRIASSYCQLCQRMHDHDNTAYIKVDTSGSVTLKCRHSGNTSINLGNVNVAQIKVAPVAVNAAPVPARAPKKNQFVYTERVHSIKATAFNFFAPDIKYLHYSEEHVKPLNFEQAKYDTIVIKSGMGTGKSVALREYIKTIPNHFRVVIVSFRRSFTAEVMGKLTEFTDYQDVKKGNYNQLRLIVQLESLHKLDVLSGVPTLVVLDESESILNITIPTWQEREL